MLRELLTEIAPIVPESDAPDDLARLSRAELVALSLRINPQWSVAARWTKPSLLERLRQWDSRVEELVALCVQHDPQLAGRRYDKEHYIPLLSAAMKCGFTAQ